jgi:5'-methylthioadenosine phosphorylase
MLGVIGGSGVYALEELAAGTEVAVATPFGAPSGPCRLGRVGETDVVFVPRHGPGHRYSPSDLPYRANVYALKALGATHVLSISAVGSLQERLPPRTRVLPDQIIDRTVQRPRTFFEGGVVAHVGLADPFCAMLRAAIAAAAEANATPAETGGTYVCIEGPQFSTRAESHLYRSWGGAVIGMTAMPEARLAREAELCYATLALVTDYDVWHDEEADVSVDIVLGHLRANAAAAAGIVRSVAARGLPARTCDCARALDGAVMTDPSVVDQGVRDRLGVVGSRIFAAPGAS